MKEKGRVNELKKNGNAENRKMPTAAKWHEISTTSIQTAGNEKGAFV